MVDLDKGSWYRRLRDAGSTYTSRGVTVAGPRWVIVGDNSGSPTIDTVETADLDQLAPTFTARTPNGSDQLNDVAYVATGNRVNACGLNGRLEFSTDQGQTWSSIVLAGAVDLWGIVAVDGDPLSRFIVAGTGQIHGQNSSGVYTTRYSGPRPWVDVAYRAGNGWVVISSDGYASQSADGSTGSFGTPAPHVVTTTPLVQIAANASYYIAVGNDGEVWRSATGLSGSWVELAPNIGIDLLAITPLAADNVWAAHDANNFIWLSTNNGASWARSDYFATGEVYRIWNETTYAMAVGQRGRVHLSFDDVQEDFVSTAVEPVPPAAFGANADMAGDAVRRLIGQFRSSS